MEHLTIIVVFESFTCVVKIVTHLHGGVVVAVAISKEFVDEFGQRLRPSILEQIRVCFSSDVERDDRLYLFIRQSTFCPDLLN